MLVHKLRLYLTAFCCSIVLGACTSDIDTVDPKTLPYTLEPALELNPAVESVDLDGDGLDEIVRYDRMSLGPGGSAIILTTAGGRIIEQMNYAGSISSVHFHDYDHDGTLEILVPYVRNDSLFVSFVDATGKKLFHFFLINGEPRREDDGTLLWDPAVRDFYLADLDADGRDELVTVVFTGYARLPRGILVHRLPNGELLGKMIVGSGPIQSFFGNFDADEDPEVLIETAATNNGAEAGGFDDQHSYIMVLDLVPTPAVIWSQKVGKEWSGVFLAYEDFDGDGRKELLSVKSSFSSKPEKARMELIEPGTWSILRQHELAESLRWPQVVDLDRDARPEIVAVRMPGEVWVFNAQFEVMLHRRVATTLNGLMILPDMDGDSIDEIATVTPTGSVLLLDPNLHVRAVYRTGPQLGVGANTGLSVIRRGFGVSPYLLVGQYEHPVALELVENRLYWVYRYGPVVLWILGLVAFLGMITGVYRLRRRTQLLQRVQALALDIQAQGFLLLDPQGRVVWMNTALRRRLGDDSNQQVWHVPFTAICQGAPALAAFLDEVRNSHPPHHHERSLSLEENGRAQVIKVVADPLLTKRNGQPHWLVGVTDHTQEVELEHARAWVLMAQRVAHDIRNPLTSILLTLQRLQMEYREQAPEIAPRLDPYSTRIEGRIEHLRRMTRNFMKFVDLEEPALTTTDLNAFVREQAESIRRGLPPDIHLTLKLEEDIPFVWIDHEQMQSVLENLMSNAVNAMAEGGKITLTTQLAQALQFSAEEKPRDYVMLEVLDTGMGIPESARRHLFEPGFTTSEGGTGLGLAIVKKIVSDHGGYIQVEGEPGTGSAFCLYLPVER